MADEEQVAILKQGVAAWNQWREANFFIEPDLAKADLRNIDLSLIHVFRDDQRASVNLSNANLRAANLRGANLYYADLAESDLSDADLSGANLRAAILSQATLFRTDLSRANLSGANFFEAKLCEAYLFDAILLGTRFDCADLRGCMIHGISAWDVELEGAQQSDLVINLPKEGEPKITVDNLEVAQFIYLLLHNEKIREVIETITSKVVLILGRFMPERKAVLDAIRDEVRRYDYLPIMFDFQKPEGRNYIETVSTLAHMARFVIADLTDAKVVLQELEHIVPNLPSVPVQPIVQSNTDISAVIIDFVGRLNFLEQLYPYRDIADVKANLYSKIIQPAEAQLTEIQVKRFQFLEQARQITHR